MTISESQRAELLALIETSHQDLVRRVNDLFDRQQAAIQSREDEPPEYRPKSALYRLAWITMRAFLSEEGRLPTALDLLDEMPVYDNDHFPVNLRFDAKQGSVHWKDENGDSRETSFKAFQNALTPMRRALNPVSIPVAEEEI